MAQASGAKISEVSVSEDSLKHQLSGNYTSIRVSPNNYFIASFIATFFIGFMIYLELDLAAIALFITGWIAMPVLAWTDRIVFDGESLYRTGLLAKYWSSITGNRRRLTATQIEQVETQAIRALKRGGNIFYRYRTSVRGKNIRFAFASGGEDYRKMIRQLFKTVSPDSLDNRSIELRDYLGDPKEVLMKAEFARIPSSDVLESSISEFNELERRLRSKRPNTGVSGDDAEKAEDLRQIANQLRLAGNLLQSLEAFRRALFLNPSNGWLVFEFARCLHSYAGIESNKLLTRKAYAVLRLSERKARFDSMLLSRIGETYYQYGEWERARKVFNKSLAIAGENFRSIRGLAEISLREGKIAHVIHHFATAVQSAGTTALRRWAEDETRYFSHLNDDESYMESEIKRINWLESIERGKRMALRILVFGIVTVLIGLVGDELVANVGWAVASVSILLWVGCILSGNLSIERSPFADHRN